MLQLVQMLYNKAPQGCSLLIQLKSSVKPIVQWNSNNLQHWATVTAQFWRVLWIYSIKRIFVTFAAEDYRLDLYQTILMVWYRLSDHQNAGMSLRRENPESHDGLQYRVACMGVIIQKLWAAPAPSTFITYMQIMICCGSFLNPTGDLIWLKFD